MKTTSMLPKFVLALITGVTILGFTSRTNNQPEVTPLQITGITAHKEMIAVTSKGNRQLSLYNSDFKECLKSWAFSEIPTGVTSDGSNLYVTTFEGIRGGVHFVDPASQGTGTFIHTGSGACYPVLSNDGSKLYICNQFSATISEIDIQSGKVQRTVKVLREPKSAVFGPDEKYLFVANYLPQQRADLDTVTSCVSVIDMATFKKIKDIPLENGSNALRGIAVSPDGNYIFITHNLGRFQVPTSQLQQGWMNTSAVSLVNTSTLEFEGAVLLDEPERGAAGIWDIKCTGDKIVITHSGTHEISVISYPEFIERFRRYPAKANLAYDLRFLYGLRERIPLTGNGPRGFVIAGNKAIVPTYFSDTLNIVDLNRTADIEVIPMVKNRIESNIHRGEKYFNDAKFCFQNWQSCNGCHPGDGRMDAMNWDLMNDGIGNSKNCKSLLYSHVTPPNMISGIRAQAEIAVRAGYTHIQFSNITEEEALCVDEYLMSLEAVPSPYLVNGELSDKAKEGRKIYEKLGCDKCHSGPYYTDMQMHRIGDDIEFEKGWDTPTLREVWRTAPYLFDGRAATMEEVFSVHKHGVTKKISKKEIEALSEYVNSL